MLFSNKVGSKEKGEMARKLMEIRFLMEIRPDQTKGRPAARFGKGSFPNLQVYTKLADLVSFDLFTGHR